MIKYNIRCHNKHEFESWFSDSSEFDNLKKKKLLECIFCLSKKVNKSIMAPMIAGSKEKTEEVIDLNIAFKNKKNKLLQLRKYIENNFEFVGENFSSKVREIYYDKREKKTIYGTTTAEERKELEDEGIDLLSVPWVSKEN